MFENSEKCDPNRVKGSHLRSKPHFWRLVYRLTADNSADSLTVSANRESNYSRKWVLTNDSLTTSVFCAGLKFWQIKKALKIKWFQCFAAICHFWLWPRRDLPGTGSTILSVKTLDFLKIMDVPFLHTRTFQCSSYIYNAKVAIIVWFQAVFSVKNSF